MEALQKEVRSLDDDSWMFAAPRSRINLVSRPGKSVTTQKYQGISPRVVPFCDLLLFINESVYGLIECSTVLVFLVSVHCMLWIQLTD